jgi:RNA-binding protein
MASDTPRKFTPEQKKQFRTIGHTLEPVVTVAGKGLSDSVLAEVNRALDDHELVKVRFAVGDRAVKKQLIDELCEKTGASLIQTIGHIALVFRKAAKQPRRSNLARQGISAV